MSTKPDTGVACQWRDAVNFDERAEAAQIELLVLHYTGMQSGQGALDWLCSEKSRVSCHYFVFDDGHVVQCVREAKRAWHAGVSSWRGLDDINSRSVGIEIANPGHQFGYKHFPRKQMQAVSGLSRDIVRRNGIALRNVVAHSDIAPMRKQDPGELFSWKQLALNGAAIWVPASRAKSGRAGSELALRGGDRGEAVLALQQQLARYGYGVQPNSVYDDMTKACVIAFQRHFRQAKIDGIADPSTRRTLARLLAAI